MVADAVSLAPISACDPLVRHHCRNLQQVESKASVSDGLKGTKPMYSAKTRVSVSDDSNSMNLRHS